MIEEPKLPAKPKTLYLARLQVGFWAVLPWVLGYAGITSLDHVNDSSARTILGLFVFVGFFGLVIGAHFVTKETRAELSEWALQKRLYRYSLSAYRRQQQRQP